MKPLMPAARRPRPESGSAYLVTLLILVVLTIIGLSLTLVTQTEMQIGANERSIQRVFYVSDAGIAVSTARALIAADYSPLAFSIDEATSPIGVGFRGEVGVSPFHPINYGTCNLCSINQGSNFYQINHALTSTGTRTGDGRQLAAKIISVMVEVQPWELSQQALLLIGNPDLEQIKF